MSLGNSSSITTSNLVFCIDPANTKSFTFGQNLFIRSQEFDISWGTLNTTISANTSIAPDGTTTADLITNTPNQLSYISQQVSLLQNTTYTVSIYVKPNTANKTIAFEIDSTGSASYIVPIFNLETLTSSGGGTRTITDVGNGWYRVSCTFTTSTGAPRFNVFYIGAYGSTPNTVSMYIWGAQIEQSPTANKYTSTAATNATGSTALTDLSGFNNNGTLVNTPSFNGAGGGSIVLNGTNQYINIPSRLDAQLPLTTYGSFTGADTSAYTIEMWIRTTQITGTTVVDAPGLVARDDGDIWSNLVLFNGFVYFAHYTTVWESNLKSSTMVADGNWHQVVFVNFSNRSAAIYIDSRNEIISSSIMSGVNYFSPDHIGRGYPGRYFNGNIGPVRFYDRSLTADEIKINYNATRGRYGV